MKLRAKVSGIKKQINYFGKFENEEIKKDFEIGSPAYLEIEPFGGLFMLYRYSESGKCVGDTCHENVEYAQEQAEKEFFIEDEKWYEFD